MDVWDLLCKYVYFGKKTNMFNEAHLSNARLLRPVHGTSPYSLLFWQWQDWFNILPWLDYICRYVGDRVDSSNRTLSPPTGYLLPNFTKASGQFLSLNGIEKERRISKPSSLSSHPEERQQKLWKFSYTFVIQCRAGLVESCTRFSKSGWAADRLDCCNFSQMRILFLFFMLIWTSYLSRMFVSAAVVPNLDVFSALAPVVRLVQDTSQSALGMAHFTVRLLILFFCSASVIAQLAPVTKPTSVREIPQ
jgi:hypothetical protein